MRPLRFRVHSHVRQRGVAVVTALLLTTLAVTIVASLFWQQQVQVRSMENQRLHLQTRWILRGALDWARLILQQDGRDNPTITRADGVWATPLADTRLDDYLERERQNNETYDATLSGQIFDAQARYNLGNLADGQGAVDAKQLEVFKRLLTLLQLDTAPAQRVADLMAQARKAKGNVQGQTGQQGQGQQGQQGQTGQQGQGQQGQTGQQGSVSGGVARQGTTSSGRVELEPLRVEDLLAVAGVTQQSIERLRDFVIVLPPGVQVNANTASAEVLASLAPNVSLADAQTLIAQRKRTPWYDASPLTYPASQATVAPVYRSDYFLVQSQVRLERAALVTWSLIWRDSTKGVNSVTKPLWIREL